MINDHDSRKKYPTAYFRLSGPNPVLTDGWVPNPDPVFENLSSGAGSKVTSYLSFDASDSE